MHQYTCLAVTFGVLLIILTSSTSASTIPIIVCPPSPMADVPQAVRQLCFAFLDKVDGPQEGNVDVVDASPPYGHVDNRGVKRQDVDHVFLRFGRRNGL